MSNWSNLIFALLIYPVLPVMYIQLRNETKPKKNIVMGVTLPYAALTSPEAATLTEDCRRRFFRMFLLLHIPLALCLPVGKYMSMTFGAMMLWMLLVLGAYCVAYIRAHRRVRDYKRSFLPQAEENAPPVQVDPEAIVKSAPRSKLSYYIPPLLISIAPILCELLFQPRAADTAAAILGSLVFTLCIVVFAGTDYILRRRSEAVSDDSAVNVALTQARRGHWARCSLWISYLTALMGAFVYLSIRAALPEFSVLIACLIYSTLLIYIAVRTDLACRHAQERLAGALPDAADTDRYWPLGMFYYNPQDSHNLVHSRTGTNSTFNMARPLGKIMMGFCALCILSIPVLAVFMARQELTPISVTVSDDTLYIDHAMAHKAVPLDAIQAPETLQTLPANSRVNGTGLPTLLEGRFTMRGYDEPCWFCLDPTQPPFVTFIYDGTRYVLNADALDGLPVQSIFPQ